ncbi:MULTISPECIES: ABC transporter substrate-binding protein [unclassified Nocardioides]|uniref:ABC transporter substrate-binding protein n=1 Tax=unclassified Nocardioides TaxID=2615069 RepID=UPI003612E79D
MRRLHRLTAAAAALTVLATLSSCSSDDPAAGSTKVDELDPDKDVTITWWTGQDSEANALLQDLVDDYTAEHPNVTIEISPGADTTDDLLQKLQAGFAADEYPDISYTYGSWASVLGTSGRTLDISEHVEAADSGWEEFPEAARATATVEDEVIGFPAVVDNLGLIYNKQLFDEAGLDYPTEDWTWDDFRTAAAELTDPARNQFGTAYPTDGGEDTVWRFWPHVWQNGGDVLDEDGQPAFDSEAGVEALEYWRTLAVDDESVYLDQTDQKFEPNFYAGHIGMLISGPWTLYDLKAHETPYGVSVLPATDGSHQTISGPDLWTLFDHGDAQRAAASYDFINWLTQPEQDVRWNLAYGNLPLRSSAAETPEFEQYVEDYPGADVFFENLQNATTPRPTVVGYAALSRAVGTAISDVLRGEGDPQEALEEAAEAAALDLQ